jgi:aryl-alcohol dehydrogenase-like predicted oxidoreductase
LGVNFIDTADVYGIGRSERLPPTDVYYRPEVFGALDRLVEAGKIRYCGVRRIYEDKIGPCAHQRW